MLPISRISFPVRYEKGSDAHVIPSRGLPGLKFNIFIILGINVRAASSQPLLPRSFDRCFGHYASSSVFSSDARLVRLSVCLLLQWPRRCLSRERHLSLCLEPHDALASSSFRPSTPSALRFLLPANCFSRYSQACIRCRIG